MNTRHLTAAVSIAALMFGIFPAPPTSAAVIRDIAFPVDGTVHFSDDFGDARSGHTHEGNDLIGAKMMPLVSAIDGRVRSIVNPEGSYGYAIVLEDSEGWTYHYLHVNNDTPGTDDGMGGTQYAYAPELLAANSNYGYDEECFGRRCRGGSQSVTVTKGQLIGWMGDSGNAENVAAHLHFEIRQPDGTAIDPYESLLAARNIHRFDPKAALANSPDINTDLNIPISQSPLCVSGSRIKTADSKAVYYCGADGKRYVFPNDKTYYSWYDNFSEIVVVTPEQLAQLQLGGNVTYRPGKKMVKIQSDPHVYVVDRYGTLRWVESPEIAASLYGVSWAKQVEDISDAFFVNYKVGVSVNQK